MVGAVTVTQIRGIVAINEESLFNRLVEEASLESLVCLVQAMPADPSTWLAQ